MRPMTFNRFGRPLAFAAALLLPLLALALGISDADRQRTLEGGRSSRPLAQGNFIATNFTGK